MSPKESIGRAVTAIERGVNIINSNTANIDGMSFFSGMRHALAAYGVSSELNMDDMTLTLRCEGESLVIHFRHGSEVGN